MWESGHPSSLKGVPHQTISPPGSGTQLSTRTAGDNVKILDGESVKMWECENLRVWKCENVIMWESVLHPWWEWHNRLSVPRDLEHSSLPEVLDSAQLLYTEDFLSNYCCQQTYKVSTDERNTYLLFQRLSCIPLGLHTFFYNNCSTNPPWGNVYFKLTSRNVHTGSKNRQGNTWYYNVM